MYQNPAWQQPYPAQRPARPTNGLAIASFVLSLLWIVGLGSLLAVIFSFQARRQIRRSKGAQGGDGLAVAGLIIGVLGLVGAGLFVALILAVGAGVHHLAVDLTPRTAVMKAGQTATVSTGPLGDNSGIATVEVMGVASPVTPADPAVVAPSGNDFAVADVKVCAGHGGSQTRPGTSFTVVLSGGTQVAPATLDAKSPSLNDVGGLGADQCGRGYLTFEVPSGATPTAVRYSAGPFRTYEWTLP